MNKPERELPTFVIIPGWRNSGPGHWQSLWLDQLPNAIRVEQADWHTPKRQAWVHALTAVIESLQGPVILVAHSLGCICAAHLPRAVAKRVHGALLVAPADPERRGILQDFAPVPYARLPYRSIVVAGDNDPFCSARLTAAYARAWGSDYVRLTGAGHINVESGHGPWPLGLALLSSLVEEGATSNLAHHPVPFACRSIQTVRYASRESGSRA